MAAYGRNPRIFRAGAQYLRARMYHGRWYCCCPRTGRWMRVRRQDIVRLASMLHVHQPDLYHTWLELTQPEWMPPDWAPTDPDVSWPA